MQGGAPGREDTPDALTIDPCIPTIGVVLFPLSLKHRRRKSRVVAVRSSQTAWLFGAGKSELAIITTGSDVVAVSFLEFASRTGHKATLA